MKQTQYTHTIKLAENWIGSLRLIRSKVLIDLRVFLYFYILTPSYSFLGLSLLFSSISPTVHASSVSIILHTLKMSILAAHSWKIWLINQFIPGVGHEDCLRLPRWFYLTSWLNKRGPPFRGHYCPLYKELSKSLFPIVGQLYFLVTPAFIPSCHLIWTSQLFSTIH